MDDRGSQTADFENNGDIGSTESDADYLKKYTRIRYNNTFSLLFNIMQILFQTRKMYCDAKIYSQMF